MGDSPPSSSRLILKNLPRQIDEPKLVRHVMSVCGKALTFTDCRVIRKQSDGRSRMFAFLGFKSDEEASKAFKAMQNTFLGTKKLQISFAHPDGSDAIPRPWSAISKQKSKVVQKDDHPAPIEDSLEWIKSKAKRKKMADKDQEKLKEDRTSGRIAAETGRIMVVNIPYEMTEKELRETFSKFGDIAEIHVPPAEEKPNFNRGYAFITFFYPSAACKAMDTMSGKILQGRTIRVEGATEAQERQGDEILLGKRVMGRAKKSEIKAVLEKMKRDKNVSSTSWNLLYTSGSAALETVSSQLGIQSELVMAAEDATDSIPARAALAETLVLKQVEDWLVKEGLNPRAFERRSKNALVDKHEYKSALTLIIKHLGPWIDEKELYHLFARYGPINRFTIAPTKTVCIVTYQKPASASQAFKELLLKDYKSNPLLLERAPASLFLNKEEEELPEGKKQTPNPQHIAPDVAEEKERQIQDSDNDTLNTAASVGQTVTKEDLEPAIVEESRTVFVSNLNFETTVEKLTDLFHQSEGFRKANITMKKRKITDLKTGGIKFELVPVGYGFVDFDTSENALKAVKKFGNVLLDGHLLKIELALAHKAAETDKKREEIVDPSKITKKMLVKNVPFEANTKDIRQLFESFGVVNSVRIPKKRDGSGRGFAFVEFSTLSDARRVYEELRNTHLLGRHLVLVPTDRET